MDAVPAAETVTVLTDGGTTYHVVGTAHVSERSVAEVREVIHRLKPDVVCVELSDPEAREAIYGMPYEEWKAKFQK